MSYDPHSNEWLLNRFDIYKDLRTRDTAYWCEEYQVYVLTRYDDVFFALNNPQIFSSAQGNLLVEVEERKGRTLGASDNPLHGEYKNIVMNAYTKDNIKRIADVFSTKTLELLDNKTEINVSDLTEELAVWLSTEIINSPLDKKEAIELTYETHRLQQTQKDRRSLNQPVHPSILTKDIDKKGVSPKFRRLFELIRLEIPHGPGAYNEYICNNPKKLDVLALVVGNMMSGPGSMAAALQYLTLDLFYENQLDMLLQDRSLIPEAVNESLRFRAGVGRFTRTLTQDITIHNVNLKPGDRVAICLESANRDESKWYKPDEFIIKRDDKVKHLAWGHGPHACIALAISKEMLRLYLKLLLDKVGKYEILTKPSDLKYVMMFGGNISMMSNIMLRKL